MLYTTASVSSIIQTSGPVFTIIFAIIILNESTDTKKIFGSICTLIGAIFLVISLDYNINIFDFSLESFSSVKDEKISAGAKIINNFPSSDHSFSKIS